MKYLFTLFVALSIGLCASARPPHAPAPHDSHHVKPIAPVHHKINKTKDYHLTYGRKFHWKDSDYWFYRGYKHNHWNYNYFDRRYGCYLYFDPWTKYYYYWCAPHYCYYPITYVPVGYVFQVEVEPKEPTTAIPLPPGAEDKIPPMPPDPEK